MAALWGLANSARVLLLAPYARRPLCWPGLKSTHSSFVQQYKSGIRKKLWGNIKKCLKLVRKRTITQSHGRQSGQAGTQRSLKLPPPTSYPSTRSRRLFTQGICTICPFVLPLGVFQMMRLSSHTAEKAISRMTF